ncbi:WRKY DNA-binding transcription factor 70 [Dendrobium catenatum]|uniref:Putative WRKY transcription factor 70 n=1 Tax=Dendrobium catenatum TaxID=906689 RepID=A0A2I0WQZ0_9ASPA|nr:WRKY DNA-binding transcription factor 70 [Dendrobium catenatum]PKU78080.1 putative WRKY transcription factor 70 [Dendrobium catenatum]
MEETPYNHSSTAIDNLSQGFEGLTQLRALFLASSPAKPTDKTLAIGLLDKALRCITAALSDLQPISPTVAVEDRKNDTDHKKRKRVQSWTIMTSVPHFDGHQWRKYGQKRIHNSDFPRSYYKCTHNKDQGCQATKTIQQKEDKVPNSPIYKVSYCMHHTCKPIETQENPFVMDSSAIMNSTSSTTASSSYSSHELSISSFQAPSSDQPTVFPLQLEESTEQVFPMESMLLSSETRGDLAVLGLDWEWQDELITLGEFGDLIVRI